jgi:heme-degrading monooxygenase HmoA
MVLERVVIHVLPGHEREFEQALDSARAVVGRAPGFRSLRAYRGIEAPHSFLLLIEWDTLEDHMEGFRGSALYGQWRALISPHFDGAPQVEHFEPSPDG